MPILGSFAGGSARGLGGLRRFGAVSAVDDGAVFPLASFIVGTSTATITISGIPDTYTHLLLTARERKTDSTGISSHLIFNADTNTANYDSIQMYGNSSTATGGKTTANSLALLGTMLNFNGTWAMIYDYKNTNKNKTFDSLTGTVNASDGYALYRSGSYFGTTSAVSSVRFTLQGASSFAVGTSYALWGVK